MGKTSKKGPSLHVILDSQGNKLETFTLQSVRKSPTTSPAGRRHSNTMPPKVYIVDPRGFRHLVQKLTGSPRGGAPAIITSRGKKGGFRRPPPIQLPQSPPAVLLMPDGCGSDEVGALPLLPEVTSTSCSSELDMNSSPEGTFEVGKFDHFLALLPEVQSPWYQYQLLSPGTLASLEQEASM